MLPGLPAVQGRPDADERGTFFDADAVILARPHRELAQAETLPELAETAEVRPRVLGLRSERRHRRKAANLCRTAVEKRLELALRHARLRLLPCEVDLDEGGDLQPLRRRVGIQRVHELADAVDRLRLPALEVADEVPAERVKVPRVLRLEVLR